mmetsp:Transcript_21747/g.70230  ORF Transcript_21747/g.70230 Transcript_21747/m.70230 type:complete len:225 (-) Transcript_21747:1065-1739(-)|eukprot:scaffold4656_cov117-Isochrysis_galbana.AAC.16
MQRRHLRLLRAINHPDLLHVDRVPIHNLAVRAAGQDLRLVRQVDGRLEEVWRKEGAGARVRCEPGQRPDDARPIGRGGDALRVVAGDGDGKDRSLVFLHRGEHHLLPLGDGPDAHLAVSAAGDELPAVVGRADRRDAVDLYCAARRVADAGQPVRVVDNVLQVARLRAKRADLAVGPAGEDGRAVGGETDAVDAYIRYLDAQQLGERLRVPDSDVRPAARGKEL